MGAMLEDDEEEDGGLDPAFGSSSAAGATSQASAAAVRAAAGADQGRRGGGALPGMEARMEEGWTTMRLAERKLLRSPRNLASSAQGPPPPRRPALAAGWTSAAGAGAGDMERPVEPKGHRRSEENGPERPRRRGTPTHPPARRSPASPLRFAPALLLTPRSLLSPLPAPCWHLAPRRRPPARPLRPGPRGGGSGGPVGGLEQSRLGAQLQLGAAEPLERDEGPRGAPPAALLSPCSATAPASLLLLLLQLCPPRFLPAPPLPPHPCSPPRAHPIAAPARPPARAGVASGGQPGAGTLVRRGRVLARAAYGRLSAFAPSPVGRRG